MVGTSVWEEPDFSILPNEERDGKFLRKVCTVLQDRGPDISESSNPYNHISDHVKSYSFYNDYRRKLTF